VVGSQDYTINQEDGFFSTTVTLPSDFNDVDMVVITASTGSLYGAFNHFVFGDAVVSDATPPTVGVVVADSSLAAGETSLVTFTFSEAVTGFTNADLTVANGSLSAVSSSDGGTTWTATLTPTAGVADSTNVISVNMPGVVDAASNAGVGSTDSNNYAVSTVRPMGSVVVADSALSIGETSAVTVTFSEVVTGFTNADLTVANGSLSAVSSSDGGVTWTASLTPTASITDSSNLITLANTGVTNAAGNAGAGTTDSNNYAIDTARPTGAVVVSDAALKAGDTSEVTVTFSEAVTGFTNADLTVDNGTLSAVSSSDGGTTWTATLTPAAGVDDAANVITLDNTGVSDAAGNAGAGTADSNNYVIDTTRPTASIVVADADLKAGETSLVTVTFSEAVTGFTNADLIVANGTLSAVSSSDGGTTWTATLTPAAGVDDAANVITLDNTGVADAAGNTGAGTTDSNNYAIDTARPTASIAVADPFLAASETSLVTVTFSEAVTGFTNADLTVANGTLSAVSSSDGGTTWTATLTPTSAVTDATNVIILDNTGVASVANSNAGVGTSISNNYAIDTARPTASIVVADASLSASETSLVTVTFSEAVTGFTNADLTVANGTLSTVTTSDGGTTWTATLTPTAAVIDAANLITLDNTGVNDAAGNAGAGTTDSNNYAIGVTTPTASIVMTDTTLNIGETSLVTFTFSEAVTGFTNADLTVANGTLSTVTTSDGGVTWTATLTPTSGVDDATNLITLNNAGVTSVADSNAGVGTSTSNNYVVETAPDAPPSEPDPVAPPKEIAGTTGADTLPGDATDNVIDAGVGADSVSGGGGTDTIEGGSGDDVLQGNSGSDSLSGGDGGDIMLGGQDGDFLQGNSGADQITGDRGADTMHGGQDSDVVQGGVDNDFVFGDKGDDIVRGGQGDDVVTGGDGDDFVSGDLGVDTLVGGAGADIFHSFAGSGLDRVLDFSVAEGDRIMLDPGTTYTLAQVGADVVISMSGSGQVVLANLQLSTLSGDWIFGA
jgi:Ca2+-binding RTX toxin-like protein